MSNVAIKWSGDDSRMFIGRDSFGQAVLSGSWPSDDPEWQEWKALKPSDLLLLSLGACTAHDVVMIMNRQRQALTGLYIDVDGRQASEPPYQFTDIHLHYNVTGHGIDEQKVARAIQLSEERYCSVAATIKGVARLSHSYDVREANAAAQE